MVLMYISIIPCSNHQFELPNDPRETKALTPIPPLVIPRPPKTAPHQLLPTHNENKDVLCTASSATSPEHRVRYALSRAIGPAR